MKPIYKKYLTTAALTWAGCFILFLFVNMLILAPQRKSKEQIEKQLAEKKQEYDYAIKAAQEETKIQLNEQIENLRDELKGSVINSEDSADLVFDISQIANEKGLAAFSIKAKDDRTGAGLEIPNCSHICENHIDISFTAGFNQFAAFLNALERHRPVIFIDSFKITRSIQGDSGHQIDMSLAVFVRKQRDS